VVSPAPCLPYSFPFFFFLSSFLRRYSGQGFFPNFPSFSHSCGTFDANFGSSSFCTQCGFDLKVNDDALAPPPLPSPFFPFSSPREASKHLRVPTPFSWRHAEIGLVSRSSRHFFSFLVMITKRVEASAVFFLPSFLSLLFSEWRVDLVQHEDGADWSGPPPLFPPPPPVFSF